jgi:hypothetical protein
MKCPHCGLFNPDTALHCDCGYDFDKKLVGKTSTPSGTRNAASRKRPTWVWVISIFYIVSFLYTWLALYLALTGAIPLDASQSTYYESLTRGDWGLTVFTSLGSLGGAVLLFLLRKQALYLFAGSFALSLLSAIRTVPKGWPAVTGTPGAAVGMFIGWGILLVVCLYTAKLAKAGILR